jgi:hypothetical protein
MLCGTRVLLHDASLDHRNDSCTALQRENGIELREDPEAVFRNPRESDVACLSCYLDA